MKTPAQKSARHSLKAGLSDGFTEPQNIERAVADVARAHMMPRDQARSVVEKVWRDEFEIMGPT